MRRRILSVLSGVSLVLCAATILLWAKSYWRGDWAEFGTGYDPRLRQTNTALRSDRGILCLDYSYFQVSSPVDWTNYPPGFHWGFPGAGRQDLLAGAQDFGWEFLGFAYVSSHETHPASGPWQWRIGGWRGCVPHASLVLAFAAFPAVRHLRHRRTARRRLQHRCVSCGYDLRATPGRCPECGREEKSFAHE